MADIRAHRWIQVDESAPTVLEITARRDGIEPRVRVEVREVGADDAADALVIEGTMLFGGVVAGGVDAHHLAGYGELHGAGHEADLDRLAGMGSSCMVAGRSVL